MTIVLIYLACALCVSLVLYLLSSETGVVAVVGGLLWPLVVMAFLGFVAGVSLGWLEGMLP